MFCLCSFSLHRLNSKLEVIVLSLTTGSLFGLCGINFSHAFFTYSIADPRAMCLNTLDFSLKKLFLIYSVIIVNSHC